MRLFGRLLLLTRTSIRILHCKGLRHSPAATVTTPFKMEDPSTTVLMSNPPLGVLFNWDFRNFTKEEVVERMKGLVGKLQGTVDQVAKTEELSYSTVLEPILDYHQWFYNEAMLLTFPLNVATNAELREGAREAKKIQDEALVEVSMRKDVFQKLQEYRKVVEATVHPQFVKALDRIILDGRRNGLHLEEEKAKEVQRIKKRIIDLQLDYQKNLSEDKTELLFTEEELAGVPESSLSILEKDEASGKFKITMKYPHILPIAKYCRVPETRKAVHKARAAQCMKENTPILEELIELRSVQARLLGFDTHAAFVLDELMAKNPETVYTFLTDLAQKLQPLWEKEREQMLAVKKTECEANGWEYTGSLDMWDTTYYGQKVEETLYSLDKEKYREYFPLDHVTKGMFEIYEKLLHLKFTVVPEAPAWFDGITTYSVHDTRDDQLMGYFMLDLFPREGKYSHFCCEQIQYSCENKDGSRLPCVAAMLCNFTPPHGEKPSLLEHDEVETYFHEFGHVMHAICGKAKTSFFVGAQLLSCSGTERDFIECPSQMLENWVWHKVPLSMMSKHYQTGEPIPQEMMDKLINSRNVNTAIVNLRQVVYGLFDQKIHKSEKCDTAETYAQFMEEILGLKVLPSTNFAANFAHLVREYDAKYYSYLWSEVFSADMFATGFGNDVLSPEKGLKYRELILQPSGTVEAFQMLRNFLGREPKPDAFLKMKGLSIN